eukprot:jgi/Mesvir1/15881/Mv02789-RA.1
MRALTAPNSEEARIHEGDLVIVYEGPDRMKPVYVKRGTLYNNRFGSFRHDAWIGQPFGCRATGLKGQGWIFLLRPTSELWTLSLPHRTQILYQADISMITCLLELRPGSVVLESGTGSGSLTHALARAVAPTGHVHTFEFHAQRAQAAADEFRRHGLLPLVSVTLRDVEVGNTVDGEVDSGETVDVEVVAATRHMGGGQWGGGEDLCTPRRLVRQLGRRELGVASRSDPVPAGPCFCPAIQVVGAACPGRHLPLMASSTDQRISSLDQRLSSSP